MSLFIDTSIEFEKVAAEVELPEDPNQWPQEILDELYKQVPFIADFQPHVVMDKVDAERAYGLGNVEIANKSEAQVGTDPSMMQAAGIRTVRIPIIIREGKLFTFDVLINDSAKALPLTESRMRQALFRPQAFDVTSQTPGDQSMIGQLYPPYRQNYGFGGGGLTVPADGMGKQSSALEEFLVKDAGVKRTARIVKSLTAKGMGMEGDAIPKGLEGLAEAGKRAVSKLERRGARGGPGEGHMMEHVLPAIEAGRAKFLKKTGSILEAILPTINESDLSNFWGAFDHEPGVQAAFVKNASACGWAVQLLSGASMHKVASVASFIKPDVIQIVKDYDGYTVKTASSKYWDVRQERYNRARLIQDFGEKVALAADTAGAVTMAEDTAPAPAPEEPSTAINVSRAGVYKVMDDKGRELTGYVIPNLIDMDGLPVPLALFTNGSQTTVQSDIIGEPVASGANLPVGEPGGTGAFFVVADDGTIQATLPMTLQGSTSMEGEPRTFVGETYDGRPAQVSLQPNIQNPVGMEAEGKLLLPAHWKWTPMDKADHVVLEGGEDAEGPPEEAGAPVAMPAPAPEASEGPPVKAASVYVRSDLSTFSFAGEPVEKLASEEREFLDVDQAMFLLAGLGVDQAHGVRKLAEAMAGAPVRVQVGRMIKTAEEQNAAAYERARLLMEHIPQLRKNLVKEAAHLPDPMAVDTVLSLNFINPENLMTFVGYLPMIDSAQSKLCELLIAARVGMQEIPISALERAVRATEEVIEGLKVVAFQGQ